MKFLRTLGVLLLVSLYEPLIAQQPLTKDALNNLGIYEGSRLRIRNAAGDANTWGWAQASSGQHFFNIQVNPQDIAAVLGYGNLGSLFIVCYHGDKIALKVKVFGGGGYNASQNVDKYVDNPYFGVNPVYFDVIPQQAPTAGTGSYVVAFRKGTGTTAEPYAYLNVGTAASNSAQYFTIDVLDAKRNAASRGTPLIYENSCYQVFIAGTPLNVWFCGVNYGNGKTLYFGNITFRTGIKDDRPYSAAAAMCILNGKNQSQLSAGTINYGDSIRIIGLHTVLSAAVNTYDEIYPWRQCSIGNTIVGWVTQSNRNFVTANDPAQVFIVTSALIPGTGTAIYDEHTPVCANDAIRLIPYWNTTSTSTYPYATSTNLWFWSNLTDPQHSGMYWNSNPPYDQTYNLFSLRKLPNTSALPTTGTQTGPIQAAWGHSTINLAIDNLNKAATQSDLAAIIVLLSKAIEMGITPEYTQAVSDAFTKAFTNALNLVQITPDIKTLRTIMTSVAGQLYLGSNLAALTTTLNSKATTTEDTLIEKLKAASTLSDLAAIIPLLNQTIGTTPTNAQALGDAFTKAFTKAVDLVKTTQDCATIKTMINYANVQAYLGSNLATLKTTFEEKQLFINVSAQIDTATTVAGITGADAQNGSFAQAVKMANPIDASSRNALILKGLIKLLTLASSPTDYATINSYVTPAQSYIAQTTLNEIQTILALKSTTIGDLIKAITNALAIQTPAYGAILATYLVSACETAVPLATPSNYSTLKALCATALQKPYTATADFQNRLTNSNAQLTNLETINQVESKRIDSLNTASDLATIINLLSQSISTTPTTLNALALSAAFTKAFTNAINLAKTPQDCTTLQTIMNSQIGKTLLGSNLATLTTTLNNKTAAITAQQTAEAKINTDLAIATAATSATIASITKAISDALTTIAAPPINSKLFDQASLGATLIAAFTKAISLATALTDCTTIKNQIATATKLFPTISFTANTTALTNKITALTPKPVAPTKAQITQLQNNYTALEKARKDAVTAVSKLTSKTKTVANIAAKYSTVITKAVSILQTTPAAVTAAYATNTTIKQTCNYVVRSIYGIFTDTNLFNKTTKKLGITSLKTSLQKVQSLTAQFPGETTYKTAIAQAKF